MPKDSSPNSTLRTSAVHPRKKPADVAGNTMMAYNYPAAEADQRHRSGRRAESGELSHRRVRGRLPSLHRSSLKNSTGFLVRRGRMHCSRLDPPFQPQVLKWDKYPNAQIYRPHIMSFPVAGSSVALPVNLTTV